MIKPFCSTALVCATLFAVGRLSQAAYKFTTIDYPDAALTEGLGISNSGTILGDYQDFESTFHAYTMTDGTFSTFDVPDSVGSAALSMNSSGTIVGSYGYFNGVNVVTRAYMLSNGNFTYLVPNANSTFTAANSINDTGLVVGSYYTNSTDKGFLYNGSMYTTLQRPGALHTVCLGINNLGSIVGTFVTPQQARHAFLYSGGSYTTFDYPGAAFTVAQGINDSNLIAGFYQDTNGVFHGFFKNGNTYIPLNVPDANWTRIQGINNAGHAVGLFEDGAGIHAFLAVPRHDGDFNGDGTVGAADYTLWRNNLGAEDESSLHDNGDGLNGVDPADYNLWKSHFGDEYPGAAGIVRLTSASTTVPEPFTLAPAMVAIIALASWTPRPKR